MKAYLQRGVVGLQLGSALGEQRVVVRERRDLALQRNHLLVISFCLQIFFLYCKTLIYIFGCVTKKDMQTPPPSEITPSKSDCEWCAMF